MVTSYIAVEGLNDNWSVHLLDRARQCPNHRALLIRDGCAWAQLDLIEADMDVFLGHPITCDAPEAKILVSWMEPGKWFVEAHNPTDEAVEVQLKSTSGWTVFEFEETVELPAATGRVWEVGGRSGGLAFQARCGVLSVH